MPHFQSKQLVRIFIQKLPVQNDYGALSLLRRFTLFVKGDKAANWSLMCCVSAGVLPCSKEPLWHCSLLGSTGSALTWPVTGVLSCTPSTLGQQSRIVDCSLLVPQQELVCTCFMKNGWGFLHLLTVVTLGVRDCYILGRNVFHGRLQGAQAASWRNSLYSHYVYGMGRKQRYLQDVPGWVVPEESVAGNRHSSERSLVENPFFFFFNFFSFITTASWIKREGLWEREATETHQPPTTSL